MTKPLSLYTGQCLLGASYGLATGQIMFIPASHSVCFFVATPSSAASISLFFTLYFCESPCQCIFLLFADFLPLLFLSDYILLIQAFLSFSSDLYFPVHQYFVPPFVICI